MIWLIVLWLAAWSTVALVAERVYSGGVEASNCTHCGEPIVMRGDAWRHLETGWAHCQLTVAAPVQT